MKFILRNLLLSGLLLGSMQGISQDRSAVIADPQLAAIEFTDLSGYVVDPTNLQAEQVVKLKIAVINNNHGRAIPAGSSKIKISLGSKIIPDPGFDLNTAGGANYFAWSSVEDGGQWLITGELVNALPANITTVDLAFRVKVREEGNSSITANFLISNHNTLAVLSDENGNNNALGISYKVSERIPGGPAAPAGSLQLSIFPNPVTDETSAKITVVQGQLMGKYRITMYDMAGKLVQSQEMQLDLVSSFMYNFGYLADGKYLIRIINSNGTETAVLKMQKF